jgi:Tfp pilus assembly protein FimT
MNNTARLLIAMAITGALAALATPELAAHMPSGTAQILAAALAAVLHRMNAEAPKPVHEHCSDECAPKPE